MIKFAILDGHMLWDDESQGGRFLVASIGPMFTGVSGRYTTTDEMLEAVRVYLEGRKAVLQMPVKQEEEKPKPLDFDTLRKAAEAFGQAGLL